MKHLDLIGKTSEEIDSYLENNTRKVIVWSNLYKNKEKIYWESLPIIQEVLMNSTGYTEKKVNYALGSNKIEVSFEGGINPSNPLIGTGQNELEAICDACSNLMKDPFNYNTFTKKYIDKIKQDCKK